MWLHCLVYIFLLNYVKSTWTDMNNNAIKVSDFCKTKQCIVKCCPDGLYMVPTSTGTRCVVPKNPKIIKLINYTSISVYQSKGADGVIDTNKSLPSQFTFIQNNVLSNPNATLTFFWCEIYILEDGSLMPRSKGCLEMAKMKYCVDFHYTKVNNTPSVLFTYRAVITIDEDANSKHNFTATAMLISSFFMSLVLVVYSVLPKLRNIVGMILMAYIFTLLATFILKSVQLIALTTSSLDTTTCKRFSPAIFYLIIASFFWLNVMSFDLWWTIRGSRKRRDIHRQGEVVKFLWYGLYSWGSPALFTLLCVAIDKYKLYHNDEHKPPFASCFAERTPTALYMHVPIGLMTAANCVLFLMTAYNVWLVKRAINNINDANNTKNSENRFIIYIKLCVLMGVSWILEVVPDTSLVPYILINFYNVFVGVAIFFMFVCKRNIIVMLCKRFHIRNRFVDKLQASQYSRSETTRSSSDKKGSARRAHTNDNEATEMTIYSTTDKA